MTLDELLARRFVAVLGKGGVGKSTMAAALAIEAARRGRRVLVAEAHASGNTGALLGDVRSTEELRFVERHGRGELWTVNLDPAQAIREFVLLVVHYKFIYNAVFENRIVKRFISFIPSLAEMVMLGKLWYHESELLSGANPRFKALMRGDEAARDPGAFPPGPGEELRFDLVILDLPSTGHGLAMLRAPAVVSRAAPPGQMRWIAQAMHALLADAERSALVLVTLPEEMPVNEAMEAWEAARRPEVGLRIGAVVANAVLPELFERPADAAAFGALHRRYEAIGDPGDRRAFEAAVRSADAWLARRGEQQAHLGRLRAAVDHPLISVPYLWSRRHGRHEVETVADHLTRAMEGGE